MSYRASAPVRPCLTPMGLDVEHAAKSVGRLVRGRVQAGAWVGMLDVCRPWS